MNKIYVNSWGSVAIFTDEGIIIHYMIENKRKRIFFPYGCIQSVEITKGLLGICTYFEVVAKDLDPNSNPYKHVCSVYKNDISELKKSIAFAKEKMETAPVDTVFECNSSDMPASEGKLIFQAATKCEEYRERRRIKCRNISLLILIVSIAIFLFGCFGPSSDFTAVLSVSAVFIGFISVIVFGNNLKPVAKISVPKSSGTGAIVKGAIIGGVVAGGAGAVVGAVVAKNKLDNSK